MLALATSTAAGADDLPAWEVGLGAVAITQPQYRGSAQRQGRLLPMPYAIYRGEFLRLDQRGLRGLLLDTPNLSLDISVDGALPAASADDGPREGMPDLDPVVEIGPSLDWTLHRAGHWSVHLDLPVRAVVATDLRSATHAGWKVQPALRLRASGLAGGWTVSASAGPVYASRAYHDYYYTVDPRFATPARPAFQAAGGYSGLRAQMGFSRRFGRLWAGGLVRYDHLAGARVSGSPLVERRRGLSAALAVAWVFGESRTRVPASRDAGAGP